MLSKMILKVVFSSVIMTILVRADTENVHEQDGAVTKFNDGNAANSTICKYRKGNWSSCETTVGVSFRTKQAPCLVVTTICPCLYHQF